EDNTNLEDIDKPWKTTDPGYSLEDDDEEVEEVFVEKATASNGLNYTNVTKGTSTPSNHVACVKGSRIILGWDPNVVDVVVISSDAQV
ncbi:hypothetical protein Tco_0602751, partial [Tanacetum coccineum]